MAAYNSPKSALSFNLTPNQIKKVALAVKQNKDFSIIVKPGDIILNNDAPNEFPNLVAVAQKHVQNGKGMKFNLKSNEIRDMKKGGALPLLALLPALAGAFGGVASGGAAIAKTVLDNKRAYRELDEKRRHNEAMEQRGKGMCCPTCMGTGLYPYKRGSGSTFKKTAHG